MDNATLAVDPVTFETGREGIFSGGDLVSGPATVVEAIAAGKEVAKAIDCYLQERKYRKEDKTFTPVIHVERAPVSIEERETVARNRAASYSNENWQFQ